MTEPVQITVVGKSEIHHPAERGTVTLLVSFEGSESAAAFDPAARLHGSITDELRTLREAQPAPITWWSTGSLQTSSRRPWNQEGKILPPVFTTATEIEAKFSDFAALAEWTSRVALLNGVTVRGIEWALTEQTRDELRGRVRSEAVASARQKAEEYAASLGLGALSPVAVADPGMLEAGMQPSEPVAPVGMRMAAALADGSPALEFTPEHITVEAAVHARFTAAPATR
ncbi:MAG TPA: SIMPL domain-containing protein [Agromyces sp.]|nr:SIMPL domain-containing protein [Agromyces sp.]